MNCHFCLWCLFSVDAGNFLFKFFCVILAFVPLEKSSLVISSYSSPGIILLPFGPLTHNNVMLKNLTHTQNGQKTGLTRSHITPTGAAQSWKLIPESSCCTGFMLMLMWKVWGSAEHWHFLCPVCITAQCCGFAITLFTVDLEREKYYKLTFCNSDILLQHHNQLQWSL